MNRMAILRKQLIDLSYNKPSTRFGMNLTSFEVGLLVGLAAGDPLVQAYLYEHANLQFDLQDTSTLKNDVLCDIWWKCCRSHHLTFVEDVSVYYREWWVENLLNHEARHFKTLVVRPECLTILNDYLRDWPNYFPNATDLWLCEALEPYFDFKGVVFPFVKHVFVDDDFGYHLYGDKHFSKPLPLWKEHASVLRQHFPLLESLNFRWVGRIPTEDRSNKNFAGEILLDRVREIEGIFNLEGIALNSIKEGEL
jgi:hypothetical protein